MLHLTAIACPYCGEPVELRIEAMDEPQGYVEDCPVCCRPIEVRVLPGGADALPQIRVHSGDEA